MDNGPLTTDTALAVRCLLPAAEGAERSALSAFWVFPQVAPGSLDGRDLHGTHPG